MKKIDLNEQDLLTLQRCLNAGEEPPHELAKRLFPSLYETLDFKTLRDARIPTIEYQGKRPEAAIGVECIRECATGRIPPKRDFMCGGRDDL